MEGVHYRSGIEPKARKLEQITYEEMLEMASLGAKSCRPVGAAAMTHKVLQVLSSFEDKPGTMVVDEENMEKQVVSGIAPSRDEAKITLPKVADQPGIAASVFAPKLPSMST